MKCYAIVKKTEPDRVRYVGQTIRALERRLSDHFWGANHGWNGPLPCWLRKHTESGVEIREICSVDGIPTGLEARSLLDQLEIYLIAYFRSIGQADLNIQDGGKTPRGEKHRESIRLAMARPEVKEKQRRSLKEAQNRPEVKEKHRKAVLARKGIPNKSKGVSFSSERREKMKAARRRVLQDPDHLVRASVASKLVQSRPDVREKIRTKLKLFYALKRSRSDLIRALLSRIKTSS